MSALSAMGGGSQGLDALAAALAPAGQAGYASPPTDQLGQPGMPSPAGGVPLDPNGGLEGPDPNYPSTEPDVITQALSAILQMQQQDHQTLAASQQAALQGNPLFQAIMGGSPTSPGAGQDGQGIGPSGMIMPPTGYGS